MPFCGGVRLWCAAKARASAEVLAWRRGFAYNDARSRLIGFYGLVRVRE
jgi:hypothetical protein